MWTESNDFLVHSCGIIVRSFRWGCLMRIASRIFMKRDFGMMSFRCHGEARWVYFGFLVFCLIIAAAAVAAAAAAAAFGHREEKLSSSKDGVFLALFRRPLLEIIFPQNDEVLDSATLTIEIQVEHYLSPSSYRDAKICLGLSALKEIEKGIKGSVHEQCLDQSEESTYQVAGLIAGATYTLRVLLADRGNVVAMSVRSFRVAAIRIQNEQFTIQRALEAAINQHQSARRDIAAVIYKRILEERPDHKRTLHLLGITLYQDGYPYEAISYIQRAMEGNQSAGDFHNTLGLCLKAVDRTQESISQFQMALAKNENFEEAHFNLGLAYQQLGEWKLAISHYTRLVDRSLSIDPILGTPLVSADLAVDAQIRICDLYLGLNLWEEANKCISKGVSMWPNSQHIHHEQGNILLHQGDFGNALQAYRRASMHGSIIAPLYIAMLLEKLGQLNNSVSQYEEFLKYAKKENLPHGHVLIMKASVSHIILPASKDEIKNSRMEWDRNLDALLPIISAHEDNFEPLSHSFSLGFFLAFQGESSVASKMKLHQLYSLYCPALLTGNFFRHDHYTMEDLAHDADSLSTHQRIKIGFISRFFHHHAIGWLFHELLRSFNTKEFEVFVFAISPLEFDGITNVIRAEVEHFVVLPMVLRHGIKEVKKHSLDILVYPELGSEHVAYFMSFTRLAKIQAVWWGHPDTSGISTIDYFVSTKHEVEDAQAHYSEELYRMQNMGVYFSEPSISTNEWKNNSQIRSELIHAFNLPRNFNLYVCIESLINLHPDFDEALNEILQGDRMGHVMLGITSNNKHWREQLKDRFSKTIKNHHRVHFMVDTTNAEILAMINAAGVVLDSIRTTSAMSSLYSFAMNTPVVTLPGVLWGSRITYGFYQELGIHECIAETISDYSRIALRLMLDQKWSREISARIHENKHKIFSNKQAIREWEKFFQYAIQEFKLNLHQIPSNDSSQVAISSSTAMTDQHAEIMSTL